MGGDHDEDVVMPEEELFLSDSNLNVDLPKDQSQMANRKY